MTDDRWRGQICQSPDEVPWGELSTTIVIVSEMMETDTHDPLFFPFLEAVFLEGAIL